MKVEAAVISALCLIVDRHTLAQEGHHVHCCMQRDIEDLYPAIYSFSIFAFAEQAAAQPWHQRTHS